MLTRLPLSAVLVLLASGFMPLRAADIRWACYYSDTAPIETLLKFDLLVLDSAYAAPLSPLADAGKTLIGYLSIGEVASTRPYFDLVKTEGILLEENRNWKGSFFIDVRDQRWTKRVVENLIPEILRRGFHGIFLDTVDNAVYLEQTNPARYRGMRASMVTLIRTIRRNYPKIKIVMNRGFDILPEVETGIDMVLGESVFADYDFEMRSYREVQRADYENSVRILKDALKRRPTLTVLTLDYWNPEDTAAIARIYRQQRANGFSPYVATVELDRIIEEPPR